jgi:hypothetical protein
MDVPPSNDQSGKVILRIKVPIHKRDYVLGEYEKAEIKTKFEMKESRAIKMTKLKITGELYEIGDRVVRIGDVSSAEEGYTHDTSIPSLKGTIMEKWNKFQESYGK